MLKVLLRTALGESHWNFLSWCRTRFGLVRTLQAAATLPFQSGLARLPAGGGGTFVYLRPGTADLPVYDQVMVQEEYKLLIAEPSFIIDAGAHIGLTSVYFSTRYPGATVVALEPELSNFRMLLRNARSFPNIRPINAGLWSRQAGLQIQDTSAATWGFRVTECPDGSGIPALDVQDVMAKFGAERVDLLKIDIEGAEIEVLSGGPRWLDKVGTLVIELHDRFRDGCSEALRDALAEFDYQQAELGDNVVVSNIRRRPA